MPEPERPIGESLTRLRKAFGSVVRAYFEVWSRRETVEGFYARGVCDGKALAFHAVAAAQADGSPASKLLSVSHLERLAHDAEVESKRIEAALLAGEFSR